MLTKIGLCGSAILDALIDDPFFAIVHVAGSLPHLVHHPKVRDRLFGFQDGPMTMAQNLSKIPGIHYIFFCAYVPDEDPRVAGYLNKQLMNNFLIALGISGLKTHVKRFVLSQDYWRYGPYYGCMKQPCEETDHIVSGNRTGQVWPMSYFHEQQRLLIKAAVEWEWEWVITHAHNVLGFTPGNYINPAIAMGLYCTISKAMPGSELPFPGNMGNYLSMNTWVSARHFAKFCLWVATAPGAGNHSFNVINGDVESFQNLWPKLAQHFGCKIPDPMFPDWRKVPIDNDLCQTRRQLKGFRDYDAQRFKAQVPCKNPIMIQAKSMGLSGSPVVTATPKFHMQIDMQRWADLPAVNLMWFKLCQRYNLDEPVLQDMEWDTMGWVFGHEWHCVSSMSKARKLGWVGYADTWEELLMVFDEMERKGIIPSPRLLKHDFMNGEPTPSLQEMPAIKQEEETPEPMTNFAPPIITPITSGHKRKLSELDY